jgi:hypothetical protein
LLDNPRAVNRSLNLVAFMGLQNKRQMELRGIFAETHESQLLTPKHRLHIIRHNPRLVCIIPAILQNHCTAPPAALFSAPLAA